MCLLSGTADRGIDHVVKFFDVLWCQVGQVGILAVVPDLLHGVNVVVQGKCQGLMFSDSVSRFKVQPLQVSPSRLVVRIGNIVDHHCRWFLRVVSAVVHQSGV